MQSWVNNNDPLPSGLPANLATYLQQVNKLPAWADRAKLRLAADFNRRKDTYLFMLYGLGSGIMSTVIPREARVGLLVRGRRRHEGPRGQDVHLRLRPERADRFRTHGPVRGHRQQDAPGARRGASPAAAVAALAGGRGRARSRSATATSWSPSTASAPSCTGSCGTGKSR